MYRYDFVRRREVAAYKNANPKMMRACFPEILKFVFRIQSIMPSKIEESDVILGVTPPATFHDPVYTLTAAAVSVLMFLPHVRARVGRHEPVFDRLLLVMDAVGLGVFTVVGVQCAYRQAEHDTLFLTVFVGLITGVGGGVLRDVFSGERPYIFVRHFYACASIIGALICALCWDRLGANAAMLFGAAAIVVLRLLAAYYHWSLPKSDYHDEPQTTTAAQTNQDSEIPQ